VRVIADDLKSPMLRLKNLGSGSAGNATLD
jgi:hypothetical protein